MKTSAQSAKAGASNSKTKKTVKDREKRKSQGSTEVNNHNSGEKPATVKESNFTRLYAGIDSESLQTYAEQSVGPEILSEEISNTLTEDINYRLRYIINDALIKARLSGQNAISSKEIEETFENLRLDKVYGAHTNPTWIQFGEQNLYCLDDKKVNLVEIARDTNIYWQYPDTVLSQKWVPEHQDISQPLKNYFTTMCQAVVSSDKKSRKMALFNIGENPRIGPITEWFYNFGYILLSKDITYDSLTLRALDLIKVLENSEMCRVNVSEKLLQLLVRLILQRLLKSKTADEVLKPICELLAVLCIRYPLKEFVILKVNQKLGQVLDSCALAIVTIANRLGIEALHRVFLPSLVLFLKKTRDEGQLPLTYSILESYNIISKTNELNDTIYEIFSDYFGDALTIFSEIPVGGANCVPRNECNFARVKCELLRTRRSFCVESKRRVKMKSNLEDVFELPPENSEVRKKMDEMARACAVGGKQVTVGKTSLLLSIFKKKRTKPYDMSLFLYQL